MTSIWDTTEGREALAARREDRLSLRDATPPQPVVQVVRCGNCEQITEHYRRIRFPHGIWIVCDVCLEKWDYDRDERGGGDA